MTIQKFWKRHFGDGMFNWLRKKQEMVVNGQSPDSIRLSKEDCARLVKDGLQSIERSARRSWEVDSIQTAEELLNSIDVQRVRVNSLLKMWKSIT